MELEHSKKIDYKDDHKDLFFVLKIGIDDIANALYNWARDSGNLNDKMETFAYFSVNASAQIQNTFLECLYLSIYWKSIC